MTTINKQQSKWVRSPFILSNSPVLALLAVASALVLPACSATDATKSGDATATAETQSDLATAAPSASSNSAAPQSVARVGARLVQPSTYKEEPPAGTVTCDGDRCSSARLAVTANGSSATTTSSTQVSTQMSPMLATATAATATARSARLPRGSNSQLLLPRNIMFADVDGDSGSEILQYASNKLFVKRADYNQTGMAHLYTARPIVSVLTGDFNNSGQDAVCPILDDGSISCYGLSPDGTDLWWWFTQGSFLGSNEDAIVGDFDGDSRDDVLVYPRSGGAYRLYSVKGSAFFNPTPNFAQGNLSGVAVSGMKLRAGDFNGDGRADIMAINSSNQILYYASTWDGTNNTFWWSFTSNGGVVNSNEYVAVGRVDNDAIDDIVLHNKSTGATRLLRMQYNNGNPPAITNVSVGQISTQTNTGIAMIRQSGNRDGAMVYDTGGNMFYLASVASPSSGMTYWWSYNQYMPTNDTGWLPFTSTPWLLVKCMYKGVTTVPHPDQWYHDVFNGDVPEWFREVSYGSYDYSGNRVVDTWYQMNDTVQDDSNLSRWDKIQRCLTASGQSRSGYSGVVAVVNAAIDSGNQGDVLLDTWDEAQNTSWFAHEMSHSLGLADSSDDSTRTDGASAGVYFDSWDIMSANNIYTFTDWRNLLDGPEMNSINKRTLKMVPTQRKQVLVANASTWQTATVNVAAIDRPEANAPLYVEIQEPDGTVYSIEFRIKARLDAGIPQTTVMVHKQAPGGLSVLTTAGAASNWDPQRLAGNSYSIAGLGTVTVNSFASTGYTAQVTVKY